MQKIKKKKNLYNIIFSSYIWCIILSFSAILLLASTLIDALFVRSHSKEALFSVTNNGLIIENFMQDDISLCYSLAENNTILYNLRHFLSGSPSEKVDADSVITELLKNYWYSHPEIAHIRILLPGQEEQNSTFRSISYINSQSEEWSKHFKVASAFILTDYGLSNTTTLYKDTNLIAICIPISADGKNIGFLCIDIAKNILFQKLQNPYNHISAPLMIIDNTGKIIASEQTANDSQLDVPSDLIKVPSSGYAPKYILGKKYLVTCSTSGKQGWRVIQFVPYNIISRYRFPVAAISVLLLSAYILFSIIYSKKKAHTITEPINTLSNAMLNSTSVSYAANTPIEIDNVYETYNALLIKNEQLIIQIKASQKQKQEAEIKSLLAQISPHFLYNTLNTILWKSFNADQPEICEIIGKLSKLCKMNYNFKSVYTTLDCELTYINLYMDLQNLCTKTEFTFSIDVPEKFGDFEIPKFILQPLVENSIIHGFYDLSRKGKITITAEADENIKIFITDNGSGIDPYTLDKLNSNAYHSEKYGIQNLNDRIKLLCGSEYGITFSSNNSNRTTAIVTLPICYSHTGSDSDYIS